MDEKKEWYLVKHIECGAVFTLEAKTFTNSFSVERDRMNGTVKCPNCNATALNKGQIDNLLTVFVESQKLLGKGVEIKRLDAQDPEEAHYSILKIINSASR